MSSSSSAWYLIDVIRERLEYPLLKRKVVETSARYAPVSSYCNLVIEDAGSGTPPIQDLAAESLRAIPFKPEGDKALRMSAQSAKIEAGHVFLPNKAPWLGEFEVMVFPYGAHDDGVELDGADARRGRVSAPGSAGNRAAQFLGQLYTNTTCNNE